VSDRPPTRVNPICARLEGVAHAHAAAHIFRVLTVDVKIDRSPAWAAVGAAPDVPAFAHLLPHDDAMVL
jgi:hypothetical protein